MFKIALALIFIASAFRAVALPAAPVSASFQNCGITRQIDFTPAGDGIKRLNLPVQVLAASPKLQYPVPGNDSLAYTCSSSVISDTGTLLTAGHCVSHCLASNGGMKQFGKDGVFAAEAIDQNSIGSVCMFIIHGKKIPYTVIAARYCGFGNASAHLSPEDRSYCASSPDYAILKPLHDDSSAPCLKTENTKAQDALGRSIATVGFPGATTRSAQSPGALDSDGKSQYMAFGNVIQSPTCTLRVPVASGPSGTSPTTMTNVLQLKGAEKIRPDHLQLSADANGGNSGGPVIDQQTGTVLGIMSVTANIQSKTAECSGSSFATSMFQIKQEMSNAANEKQIDSIFSCKKNAAIK